MPSTPIVSTVPEVSLVVPVLNEEASIDAFVSQVTNVMSRIDVTYEIVFVNDGSVDTTLACLLKQVERLGTIRVIDLSRRFGKEAALTCGIAEARGRAVVIMDGDLQHPPETIEEFIRLWREGYDMVYGVRRSRSDQDTMSRVFAQGFYWVFDRLCEIKLPRNAGDFRLMDRRVVDTLTALPERNRFMKGLYAWVGFRTAEVPYEVGRRTAGKTKFNRLRQLKFALDALGAFSKIPLRVWGVIGAIVSSLAFIYIVYRLIRVAVYGIDVPGYESILAAVLFLGGVQLLSLGILGDYVARVFDEVKGRPVYIIRQRYGVTEQDIPSSEAGTP